MAFSILETNMDPNQTHFCRIAESGGKFNVSIHNLLSDAQSSTNSTATASALDFGSDVAVLLTNTATAPVISRYNFDLNYHLRIAAPGGSTLNIFSFGPFTDLPEVVEALIITEQMVRERAAYEINKGTHVAYQHSFSLPGHVRDLNEGDIISLSSTTRSWSGIARVESHTISGSINESQVSLSSDVVAVEYKDVKRGD